MRMVVLSSSITLLLISSISLNCALNISGIRNHLQNFNKLNAAQ